MIPSTELKKRALELICSRYRDYGPTLAKGKLEAHSIRLGKEPLRQIMIKERLWRPKRRKDKRIFPLRSRRGAKGELVHRWLLSHLV